MAGVCTRDIGKALYVANEMKAGTVYVNCYDKFDAAAPFGGFKESGHGRELGEAGLNGYTENKTIIISVDVPNQAGGDAGSSAAPKSKGGKKKKFDSDDEDDDSMLVLTPADDADDDDGRQVFRVVKKKKS